MFTQIRIRKYSRYDQLLHRHCTLAFMNVLPIPGLDGGHVLYLRYAEIVTGRKPSDKFMEYAQVVGHK